MHVWRARWRVAIAKYFGIFPYILEFRPLGLLTPFRTFVSPFPLHRVPRNFPIDKLFYGKYTNFLIRTRLLTLLRVVPVVAFVAWFFDFHFVAFFGPGYLNLYPCVLHIKAVYSYCFGYVISLCIFAYFLSKPLGQAVTHGSSARHHHFPRLLLSFLSLFFFLVFGLVQTHKINHLSSGPSLSIFFAMAFIKICCFACFLLPISGQSLRTKGKQIRVDL